MGDRRDRCKKKKKKIEITLSTGRLNENIREGFRVMRYFTLEAMRGELENQDVKSRHS